MAATKSVFEFQNYRSYVLHRIQNSEVRGIRSRIATALNCHSAYITRVTKGEADFSPEQALEFGGLFEHSPLENRFFVLLVQKQRAGTPKLRLLIEDQLNGALREHLDLKNRLRAAAIHSEAQLAIYYSSWIYPAVHIGVTSNRLRSVDSISKALGLTVDETKRVVEFLVEAKLVGRGAGDRLTPTVHHLHLPSDSPYVSRYHVDWRLRCIDSLQVPRPEDFHYTSVVTIAESDKERLRAEMVKCVESVRRVARESKEEVLCAYNLDFYALI